jgi:hypothetical protein
MGKPISFGGSTIFGRAGASATVPARRANQVNEFFGLDGCEVIDGGARGAKTVVHGTIAAAGLSAFLTAWGSALALKDGTARTLVTTDGSFFQVLMIDWEPTSGQAVDDVGNVYQSYRAEFFHPTF